MRNKLFYPNIILTLIMMMVSFLLTTNGASTQQAWGSSHIDSPLPTVVVNA